MQKFFSILSNKYVLWAVIVLGIVGVFKLNSCIKSNYNEQIETYKRQVAGQLSDKERELQAANNELGLAKSNLTTQEELNKQLQKEKQEIDAKFQEFVKEHNLEIASKDETIAKLKQQIQGGNSGTTITGCDSLAEQVKQCTISYDWTDSLGRFKLHDPSIFVKDNETFTSEQYFKVYGEIWKQRDGSLETRRMVLREVKNLGDGKYEEIPGAKADIVDSQFTYTNAPYKDISSWRDLFRLRAIVAGDVGLIPNLGKTNLGIGVQFLEYKGFGMNSHTMLDFKDVLACEQTLGIAYSPRIFDTDLNLAIGLSVGTPFGHMFKNYSISTNILFYINN